MKHDELIARLRDEAGLCRNETADDIARLLDEAADALEAASLNERRLMKAANALLENINEFDVLEYAGERLDELQAAVNAMANAALSGEGVGDEQRNIDTTVQQRG